MASSASSMDKMGIYNNPVSKQLMMDSLPMGYGVRPSMAGFTNSVNGFVTNYNMTTINNMPRGPQDVEIQSCEGTKSGKKLLDEKFSDGLQYIQNDAKYQTSNNCAWTTNYVYDLQSINMHRDVQQPNTMSNFIYMPTFVTMQRTSPPQLNQIKSDKTMQLKKGEGDSFFNNGSDFSRKKNEKTLKLGDSLCQNYNSEKLQENEGLLKQDTVSQKQQVDKSSVPIIVEVRSLAPNPQVTSPSHKTPEIKPVVSSAETYDHSKNIFDDANNMKCTNQSATHETLPKVQFVWSVGSEKTPPLSAANEMYNYSGQVRNQNSNCCSNTFPLSRLDTCCESGSRSNSDIYSSKVSVDITHESNLMKNKVKEEQKCLDENFTKKQNYDNAFCKTKLMNYQENNEQFSNLTGQVSVDKSNFGKHPTEQTSLLRTMMQLTPQQISSMRSHHLYAPHRGHVNRSANQAFYTNNQTYHNWLRGQMQMYPARQSKEYKMNNTALNIPQGKLMRNHPYAPSQTYAYALNYEQMQKYQNGNYASKQIPSNQIQVSHPVEQILPPNMKMMLQKSTDKCNTFKPKESTFSSTNPIQAESFMEKKDVKQSVIHGSGSKPTSNLVSRNLRQKSISEYYPKQQQHQKLTEMATDKRPFQSDQKSNPTADNLHCKPTSVAPNTEQVSSKLEYLNPINQTSNLPQGKTVQMCADNPYAATDQQCLPQINQTFTEASIRPTNQIRAVQTSGLHLNSLDLKNTRSDEGSSRPTCESKQTSSDTATTSDILPGEHLLKKTDNQLIDNVICAEPITLKESDGNLIVSSDNLRKTQDLDVRNCKGDQKSIGTVENCSSQEILTDTLDVTDLQEEINKVENASAVSINASLNSQKEVDCTPTSGSKDLKKVRHVSEPSKIYVEVDIKKSLYENDLKVHPVPIQGDSAMGEPNKTKTANLEIKTKSSVEDSQLSSNYSIINIMTCKNSKTSRPVLIYKKGDSLTTLMDIMSVTNLSADIRELIEENEIQSLKSWKVMVEKLPEDLDYQVNFSENNINKSIQRPNDDSKIKNENCQLSLKEVKKRPRDDLENGMEHKDMHHKNNICKKVKQTPADTHVTKSPDPPVAAQERHSSPVKSPSTKSKSTDTKLKASNCVHPFKKLIEKYNIEQSKKREPTNNVQVKKIENTSQLKPNIAEDLIKNQTENSLRVIPGQPRFTPIEVPVQELLTLVFNNVKIPCITRYDKPFLPLNYIHQKFFHKKPLQLFRRAIHELRLNKREMSVDEQKLLEPILRKYRIKSSKMISFSDFVQNYSKLWIKMGC